MEVLRYHNMKEFAKLIADCSHMHRNEELSISVIAHYEYIVHLAEELIRYGCMIFDMDIKPQKYDGYCKEFALSLYDGRISITRLWHGVQHFMPEGYNWIMDDLVFVHQDCSSKILHNIPTEAKYEFSVAEYDED